MAQLGFRVAVGIVLACLPLADLNPLHMMGTAAGLTSFLVVEETFGKLRRGEPIAKLNASEEEAAAAHRAKTEDLIEEEDLDEKDEGNSRKSDERRSRKSIEKPDSKEKEMEMEKEKEA